jgi:catalase (peroxidase I)
MTDALNLNAIRSEIRLALINQKANACPMAARVAWHAAGTYDASDDSGGTDGATMRFEPEKSDPANAGLSIIRDMLHPVRVNHPELSEADLWGLAGAMAVEFLGGPAIPCAPSCAQACVQLRLASSSGLRPSRSRCPPWAV